MAINKYQRPKWQLAQTTGTILATHSYFFKTNRINNHLSLWPVSIFNSTTWTFCPTNRESFVLSAELDHTHSTSSSSAVQPADAAAVSIQSSTIVVPETSCSRICVFHSSSVSIRQTSFNSKKFVNASLISAGRVLILTNWIMNSIRKLASCVILDLDGTLVNTDGIVSEVLKVYLVKYEKKWDGREACKIIGKTPIEAAAAIVEDYGLPLSKEDLLSDISPMFSDQWCKLKALPGAYRLIKHLRGHGVQMALASNSPRASIETKISYHPNWKESFSAIVAGDEVKTGKPSPEIFLEAAKRLSIDPSKCLVIEDSLPGINAAKAAEMEVVAVPSIPKQSHLYTAADEVINSLLDLRPEKWGLPPFEDWVDGTLPLEPWYIGGPVIKGYGRGSKVLGIPTANLSVEGYATVLEEHPAGVYFGWAKLSTRGVYKMVMSIGWNPYFNNTEKTIEPWLLHDFDKDFYGEGLHLVIVGYIRPEANFPSLESLVAKIHEDGKIAENALELPMYAKYKDEAYFKGVGSHL